MVEISAPPSYPPTSLSLPPAERTSPEQQPLLSRRRLHCRMFRAIATRMHHPVVKYAVAGGIAMSAYVLGKQPVQAEEAKSIFVINGRASASHSLHPHVCLVLIP